VSIDPGRLRVRRRRSRRRRRIRRLRVGALFAVLLVALLTSGWLVNTRIHHLSKASAAQPPSSITQSLSVLATQTQIASARRVPARPVYRYSVIPGGVRTPEELQLAAQHDRAVAEHYAGFRYDKARLVRLRHAELVYLSYRMNGKIYWTRTRHMIPAGETIITDGQMAGRTRCANQLSVRKQLSVSPNEPLHEALDQIDPPAMLPPQNLTFPGEYQSAVLTGSGPGAPWLGPQAGTPWFLFPPPLPVGLGRDGACRPAVKGGGEFDSGTADDRCRPPSPPPNPPPATVPEPGTWILLGTGLVAAGLAIRRKRASLQ
jgi:hypothetical protein